MHPAFFVFQDSIPDPAASVKEFFAVDLGRIFHFGAVSGVLERIRLRLMHIIRPYKASRRRCFYNMMVKEP